MRPIGAFILALLLASVCQGAPADYTWHESGKGMILRKDGKQVGYLEAGKYFPLGADWRFGDSCEPPVPAPCSFRDGMVCYGVFPHKVAQESGYRVNGKDVGQQEAFRALGDRKDGLADDTAKLRLTVVLPDEVARQRILQDVRTHPAFSDLRGKLLVQEYAPTEWATSQVGIPPGVLLQTPPDREGRGKVLLLLKDYPGPDRLAEYVRRADPRFQPDKVPDPNSPLAVPDWVQRIPVWAWLAAGMGVGLVLTNKKGA